MEKTVSWGWDLSCFFLSFANHENYSIKNICVYSKRKIKTKLTSKQNPEHFKIINRGLLIHKFCNNLKVLLFSVSVLVFFVSTNFSIHSYLVPKSKNKKI